MHPIERLRHVARAGDEDGSILAEEAAFALGALEFDQRALVPATRRLIEFHPTCGALWWVCAELLNAQSPRARAEEVVTELVEDPTPDELAAALPGAATVVTTGGTPISAALGERPDLRVHLVGPAFELRNQLRRLEEVVAADGFSPDEIADAVADADLLVIEADALGPSGVVVSPLSRLLLDASAAECWIVAPRGRVLPGPLFDGLCSRIGRERRGARTRRDVGRAHRLDDGDAEPEDPSQATAARLVPLDRISVVVGPDGPTRPEEAIGRVRCPIPSELLTSTRSD